MKSRILSALDAPIEFESRLNVSLPPPPVRVSRPDPPLILSLPKPALIVSLPASPFNVSAAPPPMIVFASAFPDPVKLIADRLVRFSTSAPRL